jgi:hypothetical protein
MDFKAQILAGIPSTLPAHKNRNTTLSHAPVRKDVLNAGEKKLSIKNALRYFPKEWHLYVPFYARLCHLCERHNGVPLPYCSCCGNYAHDPE